MLRKVHGILWPSFILSILHTFSLFSSLPQLFWCLLIQQVLVLFSLPLHCCDQVHISISSQIYSFLRQQTFFFFFSSPLVTRCIWSSLNLASCDDWESWGSCRPIGQLHVWSKSSQPDMHVILLEYFWNDFQQNTWCNGLGCLSWIQVASSMCWWAPVNMAWFLSC